MEFDVECRVSVRVEAQTEEEAKELAELVVGVADAKSGRVEFISCVVD